MNIQQLDDIRRRFKLIGQLGGADPSGLSVIVPVVDHHGGPSAVRRTERLLQPLLHTHWLNIGIADHGPVEEAFACVKSCDEVWCVTCQSQSEASTRPARIFTLAQAQHHDIARRFKMIHFWIEPVPEAPPKKPHRQLRGR